MNTRSFIFKSLIALGAVAVLSTSAVAGPRGHVKPFDGARNSPVGGNAQNMGFANPTTPTGFKTVPMGVRKTGGNPSGD